MPSIQQLVFCTCPDRATALKIAEQLVDDGLAACVNLVPGVTSVYQWQGRREQGEEVLLLIKSLASRYAELERRILGLHPYELPEILAVTIEQGLPAYLAWITRCVQHKP